MNYESSAKQILNVLGKGNIQSATHCMTRLRFVLKDEAGIDDERVKKIPGVSHGRHAQGRTVSDHHRQRSGKMLCRAEEAGRRFQR